MTYYKMTDKGIKAATRIRYILLPIGEEHILRELNKRRRMGLSRTGLREKVELKLRELGLSQQQRRKEFLISLRDLQRQGRITSYSKTPTQTKNQ